MSEQTNILLKSGTNELEIVEFKLFNQGKDQSFGINIAKVREVIRMPKLTDMPDLSNCVKGVFNLRGSVIPALDLKEYLFGEINNKSDLKMIIAEFNKIKAGFIVDDVENILRVSWTDIVSPETIQEFDPEKASIIGILNYNNKHIMMLDVEKIVADIDPRSAMEDDLGNHKFEGKPTVITAEDSTTIRNMITQRLKRAGFEILSYQNGQEAWDKLEEITKSINEGGDLNSMVRLVITDVEMPMMDGYTLTKKIKEHDILKELPVVIFSSLVSEDVMHKGQSVGADAQMTKPQIGELLEVVTELIT